MPTKSLTRKINVSCNKIFTPSKTKIKFNENNEIKQATTDETKALLEVIIKEVHKMRFRKGDIVERIHNISGNLWVEVEECDEEYFSGTVVYPEWERGRKVVKADICRYIVSRPAAIYNNTPQSTFYPEKCEETVLQIEYMPVYDKYAVRISYQDEEVLCRDEFEDTEIGVSSVSGPTLHDGILYVKGYSEKNDDKIIIATKEELDIIKDKVKRINEKYGSKSIKHYTSLLNKALKEAKEYSNKIKSLVK